jgi:4-hydroxy-3-polyprenylbenzoate decarboxylase
VHAVDAAGVHPLLLAIGSERYTPYIPTRQPAELLTIANHILGTGQLSLAKYLFITADDRGSLHTHNVDEYLQFILERIVLERDIHFHTHTTIDTLDYSGTGLNSGSKVVFAAYGDPVRKLETVIPECISGLRGITGAKCVMPGVLALQTSAYTDSAAAAREAGQISAELEPQLEELKGFPMIVWCDDAAFTAATLRNFLWITFTRSNPSHDIYGVAAFTQHKHWGCSGPVIIDARTKPHHAPPVVSDPAIEKRIDPIFSKGGSLAGL